MDELAEAIYQFSERHQTAIKTFAIALGILAIIISGALENGLI